MKIESQQKKLRRATYAKISSLAPGTNGHNLVVHVQARGETIERKRNDGTISKMAEVTIADETGCVLMTARNDQIDKLVPGANAVIRNSSIEMHKGFLKLVVTQWGKVSAHPDGIESTPPPPTSFNMENNLSAVEYELVTVEETDDS